MTVLSLVVIIHCFIISRFCESIEDAEWTSIEMPKSSYFIGFDPPTDKARWKQAAEDAASGKQLLLKRVLDQVIYPGEIISGDIHFGWLHRMGDVFVSDKRSFESELSNYDGNARAAITLIGYADFEHGEYEGGQKSFYGLGPTTILNMIKEKDFKFPKKIVGIGHMNENWGWLSTHILNRTCTWGMGFTNDLRKSSVSALDQVKPMLDDPNLVMLLVNQHHNISHPKVISLPRGTTRKTARLLWDEALLALQSNYKKEVLLFSGSSAYRHRPAVNACVQQNMGKSMVTHMSEGTSAERLSPQQFLKKLIGSYAVLSLPGLGYDCFRIWETLLAGSMPVLEKNTGLDRSLYKLPALQLDDFAYATPYVIKQAYIEALYYIDEWDYSRITERHWQRIIFEASKTGTIDYMLKLHPMSAEDNTFTRPLVPFDCKKMGGCGPGTKRVPLKSCAIDINMDFNTYDWNWYETSEERVKRDRDRAKNGGGGGVGGKKKRRKGDV